MSLQNLGLFYRYSLSQFKLAIFQVLKSYMWQVATVLHSTIERDRCGFFFLDPPFWFSSLYHFPLCSFTANQCYLHQPEQKNFIGHILSIQSPWALYQTTESDSLGTCILNLLLLLRCRGSLNIWWMKLFFGHAACRDLSFPLLRSPNRDPGSSSESAES